MSKLTVTAVKAAIGTAAGSFSDKGLDFLKKRGNGGQSELAGKVFGHLKAGDLSRGLPKTLAKDVQEAYGLSVLNDAQIAVIILGRPPRGTDKVHEASRVPTPEQRTVAEKLARKVMKGEIYANHQRKRKVTLDQEAPETTDSEQTQEATS